MIEDTQKVKVAVRVRPLNKREIDLNTKCVVLMDSRQATLRHPSGEKTPKSFTFDHCFYSVDRNDPSYADQEEIFKQLGSGVLQNAFSGYNACIIAYGQTGSGKSYSMMGTAENPGIIPRLCDSIFRTIEEVTTATLIFKVEVSYMEIYNERVRDLLDPRKSSKNLKVREHKILGPMVDGLSILAVSSYQQIASLIEEGNKSRTVAATNMNAESSRSHAVFSIRLTQTITDVDNGYTGEKVSKISLVDLAGSERAVKSGAVGKRLEEGGNINKSLTTLGMVISALAENSRSSAKAKFVPYRDSVLTWLLKDNLGGNSKTVMIATISPSSENYEETLSTLRYADRAKRIVNHAVVNEDPNAKIIRELREEVELLRTQITQSMKEHNEAEELRERLAESERLVEQMNKSWDERLRETEAIYKERQKDLEEIGISVAGSGIKVQKDRFYLVNLNADPSLNELLVYYINQQATVGSSEQKDDDESRKEEKVDIILQGLGVHRKHAFLEIVQEDGQQRMYVEPLDKKARICVNGRLISQRTLLRNGYRLLIGNNHFFRVNCPKEAVDMNASLLEESTAMLFDYDDAWREVNCESDENANPITMAVDQYMEQIAKKHEEDKQAALEQQYEAFEKYIQGLAQGCTPITPMTPCSGFLTPGTSTGLFPQHSFPNCTKSSLKSRFLNWAERRKAMFKESLERLKKDIVKANALVREANMIGAELSHCRRKVTYDVTLQIPAANLKPFKIKTGEFICEPVIVVKRAGIVGHQLWSVAQLESKLVDMREMYDDKINGRNREYYSPDCELSPVREPLDNCATTSAVMDDYIESQENHSLIGVANVFLEVFLHDLRLNYHVPIINQQGEVSGRLHVEVFRCFNSDDDLSYESAESLESERDGSTIGTALLGRTIKCRVRIKKATNLPLSLSHFVFCQYSFFNFTEIYVVAPQPSIETSAEELQNTSSSDFYFDHEKDFVVTVNEEFLEYVQEDALSIEVWGHRSSGFGNDLGPEISCSSIDAEETYKTLQERWTDVTCRLELRVSIMELNDDGYYVPVEVQSSSYVQTGGIYQLKQGQQRRIVVSLCLSADRGNLPLVTSEIQTVTVGDICSMNQATEKPLDSYQEEDLDRIRSQWMEALAYRHHYLENQINALSMKGQAKSEKEAEREKSLIDQWVALTEERNAVSVPAVNSGIPGAPADWDPPPGIEQHVPVIFLNLNADDMTEALKDDEDISIAGLNAVLPEEHGCDIAIPILDRQSNDDDSISATCSWDSSIHEHTGLNRNSGHNEVIYATVKVVVRLSYPCIIDVVLRKRICMHLYKKPSLTGKLMKKFVGSAPLSATGVFYDLVAHVPKSSLDVENRATLAIVAAGQTQSIDDDSSESSDSDRFVKLNYIEAYTKSIQAVESMLKLDRLRQEVAINGMLLKQERLNRVNYPEISRSRMKRAVSLPDTSLAATINGNLRSKFEVSTEPADKRRLTTVASTSSNVPVPSFISPFADVRKLPGIHEEDNCCNSHIAEYICKSSTVPEYLKLSSNDCRQVLRPYTRREMELDGHPSETLTKIVSNNLRRCRIDASDKEQARMNSSFASDSGCMMESGSSIATTEDDRKNFSLEDMTVVSGCCCEMFTQENCTAAKNELNPINMTRI